MQRGRAWLLLVTALAVAAYLAWALLIRTSAHGSPRPSEPPPTGPHADSRPETRTIAAATSDEASAGTTASTDDRIEGTVTDESGHPVPDADVQIIWFEF